MVGVADVKHEGYNPPAQGDLCANIGEKVDRADPGDFVLECFFRAAVRTGWVCWVFGSVDGTGFIPECCCEEDEREGGAADLVER